MDMKIESFARIRPFQENKPSKNRQLYEEKVSGWGGLKSWNYLSHSYLNFIKRWIDWRAVLAFALPFILYLLTLAPTIYNLDSAELTTAAFTGGLVRATGYPLYLLIGRIWSRIPLGDVGYRMNLFSAFCGALTMLLTERIFRRLHVNLVATFGALGLLTCSMYFWALSLIAEVYTLHTVLMASLILALLYWSDAPSSGRLAGVGLVLGLSLGHHLATVLLIPGCIWYVVTTAPRQIFSLRSVLYGLVALMIGLSVYLYLPICYAMDPTFNYAGSYDTTGQFHPVNLQTFRGLWWLVSGRSFAGNMLAYSGYELWGEIKRFSTQLWRTFLGVGIGPGLVGVCILARRNWRLGGALLLMFLGNVGFYINYRVADKVTMFLPTYLIWAIWLGIGYNYLLEWVSEVDDFKIKYLSIFTLYTIIISVVLVSLFLSWPLVDLSDDWSARERGEDILQEMESNALIFGWWDTVPVIEYLQLVEGKRPDVQAINRFLISSDDMLNLIKRDINHRPVYIDNLHPSLLRIVEVESVGPLYRMRLRDPLDSDVSSR
jgi:hypothetical protein